MRVILPSKFLKPLSARRTIRRLEEGALVLCACVFTHPAIGYTSALLLVVVAASVSGLVAFLAYKRIIFAR